ncbi:cytochrome c oxidase subunit 2 [Albimonas donghaensis]|uniref:Cytochrome c oxidase subunit 2 n=1 Tax=Albimonas donghaensis TaxID=356660 RepID=A0A1H2VRX4_9RHOB|nr:cytochrome c oxidase subunit II [Albimonas donghaensis]SDW70609.1 cytochrome c oxidase subunit 2 [Albimonas donghaensis]
MRLRTMASALGGLAALLAAPAAFGQDLELKGIPHPGGTGFQVAATEVARDLHWLEGFLLVIITVITLFVTALLAYVVFRYNEKSNKTPATFTHNSLVEVVWTVVPIVILVVIAIPSLQLLNKQMVIPDADVTIKATGNQWYWSYEYPDSEFAFDSYMVAPGYKDFDTAMAEAGDEIEAAGVTRETWLLQTDTAVVVPVGKVVRLQVTGADVIHSWAMPAFGVKIDAVPGRLNETWFQVDEPGVYFGQCSELCGKDHAYMPIMVHAVPQAEYEAWLAKTAEMYAGVIPSVDVAALQ